MYRKRLDKQGTLVASCERRGRRIEIERNNEESLLFSQLKERGDVKVMRRQRERKKIQLFYFSLSIVRGKEGKEGTVRHTWHSTMPAHSQPIQKITDDRLQTRSRDPEREKTHPQHRTGLYKRRLSHMLLQDCRSARMIGGACGRAALGEEVEERSPGSRRIKAITSPSRSGPI